MLAVNNEIIEMVSLVAVERNVPLNFNIILCLCHTLEATDEIVNKGSRRMEGTKH